VSGYRLAPLLLAFCAVAVAALAVGPFIYRSMLPASSEAPATGCAFLVVTGGLVLLLVGATIWQLRRSRRPAQPDLDRRLWEAALGEDEPADLRAGDRGDPRPGPPADRPDR
jgi:lysylphosphatidylglycerol synthetase-like protein (DUF2156 family)